MTNNKDISKPSTMVAIDIALWRNEVLIQPPDRKRYRNSMTNERVDHDRLVQHLERIGGTAEINFFLLAFRRTAILPEDSNFRTVSHRGELTGSPVWESQ